MKKIIRLIACTIIILLNTTSQVSAQATLQSYDVVVYTATEGGVMAAIAAARAGSKVILIEPGSHIGGMVSGGLSHTDLGDRTVIGGLAWFQIADTSFTLMYPPFVDGKGGKLLPLVNPLPMVEVGQADKAIQSYQFRIVITKRKDNQVTFLTSRGIRLN